MIFFFKSIPEKNSYLILPVRNAALVLNNRHVLEGWLLEQLVRAALVGCLCR